MYRAQQFNSDDTQSVVLVFLVTAVAASASPAVLVASSSPPVRAILLGRTMSSITLKNARFLLTASSLSERAAANFSKPEIKSSSKKPMALRRAAWANDS